MAEHEYFSHYSPEGVSPWCWFDEAGYVYAHAGENLAIHFTDSTEVVEAWMDSPTHRENIVDPKYTEIGVGTARGEFDGYDTVYVVQLFGAPAYVPPTPTSDEESVPEENSVPEPAPEPLAVESPQPTPIPPSPAESGPAPAPAAGTQVAAERADALPEPPPAPTAEPTATTVPTPVAESASSPTEVEPTPPLTPTAPAGANEVVVLQSPLLATSSGLAVAQVTTPSPDHAGATVASLATQPNRLLEIVYVTLGVIVVFLLSTSVLLEARRLHVAQAAYGVFLLVAMGALWYVHSWLTSGAVIV